MRKMKIENKARTPFYRRKESDTYHFHPDCQHFKRLADDPDAIKVMRVVVPSGYEACDECQAKAKHERTTG